jgi:hypothetical protein
MEKGKLFIKFGRYGARCPTGLENQRMGNHGVSSTLSSAIFSVDRQNKIR